MQTLTLLSGVALKIGEVQSTVVPEVFNVEQGEFIQLENAAGESLGIAQVEFSKVTSYALLQRDDLYANAHPEFTAWHTGYEVLKSQIEEFSQCDPITVIVFVSQVLPSVGLEVHQAETVEIEPEPAVEEQYANLEHLDFSKSEA